MLPHQLSYLAFNAGTSWESQGKNGQLEILVIEINEYNTQILLIKMIFLYK